MAEPDHDSGSKDRATVALVAAQVGEVKAIVAGHAEVTAERLEAIKESILPLKSLPERVRGLESQGEDHERRLNTMDERIKGDRDWRRGSLPALVISALVALIGIVTAITQIH